MPTHEPDAAVSQRPTRAKIVATLGPACDGPDMVKRLIEAGVSAFRLNFSHGDFAAHGKRLEAVRAAARELRRPTAVFGDLCGPKIRVGTVPATPEGGIMLESGFEVLFRDGVTEAALEDGPGGTPLVVLPTTYPALIDEVRPGHRVLINDGAIRMLAVDASPDRGELRCRVTLGGAVTTGKGINLPDTSVGAPAITERDWECVEWGVRAGLDFLALSFVRAAGEVLELKARLAAMLPAENRGGPIPVIAKIEKPQAVRALDEIVQAADAIMVARGDLGVEMDIAQVPVVQKQIVARCQAWGKPCIVATQMLETMIQNASPTRAEASDVANAVFDGADAVMLSGETAVGKHPALVVDTMRRIIAAAEARIAELPYEEAPPAKLVESRYATAALAHGAWHIAKDIGARLVVCWSESGGTARYLSQNDFRVPIIAYTTSVTAARRMSLLKGVTPIRADAPAGLGAFTDLVERDVLSRGWVRRGEPVLLLAGKPLGRSKATNSIATFYLGDPIGGYRAHSS
jgi:pyruvate kinase